MSASLTCMRLMLLTASWSTSLLSGDCCAIDDPRLSPLEPLPDPAPPEKFGNPQQVPVYAACKQPQRYPTCILGNGFYQECYQAICQGVAHEKTNYQVHSYASDSVSVAKSSSAQILVTTIGEVCAILSQSGLVGLGTSRSVQLSCNKHCAISLVIGGCASCMPFCQLFPALSPLLMTGLLLHLIPYKCHIFCIWQFPCPWHCPKLQCPSS